MVNKRNLEDLEKKGDFGVVHRSDGWMSVYRLSDQKHIGTCPPGEEILNRWKDEGKTGTLKRYLAFHSLRNGSFCEMNMTKGRADLGITDDEWYSPDRTIAIPLKDIVEGIREFWPEDLVNDFMAGKDVEIGSVKEFKTNKESRRIGMAITRSKGLGFSGSDRYDKMKEAIRKAYPEHPLFPAALTGHWLKSDVAFVDPEEVSKELLDRYYEGLMISPTYLARGDFSDRLLCGKVKSLFDLKSDKFSGARKKGLGGINLKFLSDLTSIPINNIKVSRTGFHEYGALAESFTRVLGLSSAFFNEDYGIFLEGGWVLPNKNVDFSYLDDLQKSEISFDGSGEIRRNGLVDLRFDNWAFEVKTGVHDFSKRRAKELIKKYSPNNSVWEDGWERWQFTGSSVIFHMRPEFYEPYLEDIKNSGIYVVDSSTFRSGLEKAFNSLGMWSEDFENHDISLEKTKKDKEDKKIKYETKPLIRYPSTFDNLLLMYDDMCHRPQTFLTEANRSRREYASDVLKIVSRKLEEMVNEI